MKTAPLVLLALLAAPSSADTIVKTDGKKIENVRVQEETLTQVIYRDGNQTKAVPSEEVLSVSFERMPRLVEEAEQALADDDPGTALHGFQEYAEGQAVGGVDRRFPWAAAYAAHRAIELQRQFDALEGLVSSADRLIQSFPDTRYVPSAYLAKATALRRMGKDAEAQAALKKLQALVQEKGLSRRWDLESQIGLVLTEAGLSPAQRRERLEVIVAEAGREYPTVRNRALVAKGETLLAEAEKSLGQDRAKALDLYQEAEELFRGIVQERNADAETLAGAYAGLGDALVNRGIVQKDDALVHEALKDFMRVVVLYPDQSRYVAKSLFWAMRCFGLKEDGAARARMKRELQGRYPGSDWAELAEKF